MSIRQHEKNPEEGTDVMKWDPFFWGGMKQWHMHGNFEGISTE